MARTGTTRIETSLLTEDAELLAKIATGRNMSVAELVRQAIYTAIPAMSRANDERNARVLSEMDERARLADWTGLTDAEKRATYDRVVKRLPRRHS